MTTGIEFKIVGMIAKTLFLPAIVYFFAPIYDWITLQVITDYSLLSPFEKALLNDFKLILGVFVTVFALIRLAMGSYKLKKEIEILKKQQPPTPKGV